MNATFLIVTFTISAPGPKDEPKKDAGLLGEWVVESVWTNGKAARTPTDGMIFEFTPDGQWLVGRDEVRHKALTRYVKMDETASPRAFDVYLKPPGDKPTFKPNLLGIFKVEGDKLTIVFGEKRPTEFAAPKDGAGQMVVLKRAKK